MRTAQPVGGRFLKVIAKLKPGIPIAQAQNDLGNVEREIARTRPAHNRDWSTNIVSLHDQTTGDVRSALLLLFGAVGFVLLIACGNLANLLLMRGTERRREIAVRGALGASRARLVSQLLTEGVLLSFGGGVLGIAFAFVSLRVIASSFPALSLPHIDGAGMDGPVLLFALALSILCTLLFGAAPAFSFSRTDPNDALKESNVRIAGPRGQRIRALLVVSEVALSLVLLVGAGLLARTFLNVTGVERGFRVDDILTMRMFFAPARYGNKTQRAHYVEEILTSVRALPGVEAASSVQNLPMTGSTSGSCFTRADQPAPAPGRQPGADFSIISPRYFEVMGMPLLSGRDFDQRDTMTSEAGIILNKAFAERFFRGEDPIGKRLNLCWDVPKGVVIGVVANARQTDLKVPPSPTIFLNHVQTPSYYGALVVRTSSAPSAVVHSVEDAIHGINPDQAISHIETMEQVISDSVARSRVISVVFAIFAAIALVLACVGLYGVLAYLVTQQTREIGIRMAIGADPSRLLRHVLWNGVRLQVFGIVAGVAASLLLARLLSSLLYGVKPTDPGIFLAVCAALLAVGLVASWLPAYRATKVDPMTSLRWE